MQLVHLPINHKWQIFEIKFVCLYIFTNHWYHLFIGLVSGIAGQLNSFKLDARDAGFGDFDVVIKGVSRATIEYIEEEEGLYKIKYHVSLPGLYLIEIKYDLKHIPGMKYFVDFPYNSNLHYSNLSFIRTNFLVPYS